MFQQQTSARYEPAIDCGIACALEAAVGGGTPIAARETPASQTVLPLAFLAQRRSIVMPSAAAAARFLVEAR